MRFWRLKEGNCVYVIHGVGTKYYKIGRTTDIKNRLKHIQSCSPTIIKLLTIHYIDDAVSLEEILHVRFQHVRRDGSEWFKLSADDVKFLLLDTNELIYNFPLLKLGRTKPQEQNIPSPYSVVNLTSRPPKPESSVTSKRKVQLKPQKDEPKRLYRVPDGVKIPEDDLPSIDDEFQYGLLPEIQELYDELGTWEAVGKHYGVQEDTIRHIANHEVMPIQNELRTKFGLSGIYSTKEYMKELARPPGE